MAGGWWLLARPIPPPQISVSGGHLLAASGREVLLRADTPSINVTLEVPPEASFTPLYLTVQNVAASRIALLEAPPGCGVQAVGATVLRVSLPPLPQGLWSVRMVTGPASPDGSFSFAVFGDSRGFNEALSAVVEKVNQAGVDFAIHLGDLTPMGTQEQYQEALSALNLLQVPVYLTPGNHDVQGPNSSQLYREAFGATSYSFSYGGVRFVGVDTSSLHFNETQQQWLAQQLEQASSRMQPIIVFTHTPPFDPRPGGNHSLLSSEEASSFHSLMVEYGVSLVVAGHIHIYNFTQLDGVRYLVSGGAGAALHAPPEEGGFYHYVRVTVAEGEVDVEPVEVDVPPLPYQVEIVGRTGVSVTLGLHDLESLATVERVGQFENIYGNLRGFGLYWGVLVSDLLELVGGMEEGDTLVAEAEDGVSQSYGYGNVYPNASWYERQGYFVLAITCNGSLPPEWSDGVRLVFLPKDGCYDNSDCQATSYPGQGYNVYPSAGARWLRWVIRLTVLPSA